MSGKNHYPGFDCKFCMPERRNPFPEKELNENLIKTKKEANVEIMDGKLSFEENGDDGYCGIMYRRPILDPKFSISKIGRRYRTSYEHDIKTLTRREPLGVVGAITPWNFPLALTCSRVSPGLAAGNCVIHKPASDTPLTALALAQVALDAGVPEGVYNPITGPGGAVDDALVKSRKVDKIAFTGSTSVGRVLDLFDLDTDLAHRWTGVQPSAEIAALPVAITQTGKA